MVRAEEKGSNMKTILLLALALFTSTSFAKCEQRVETIYKSQNPRMSIRSVARKGSLKANTEVPYLQGEIWNNTNKTLGVYEIEAVFMARFVYVALVDESNCAVKNIIEVLYE